MMAKKPEPQPIQQSGLSIANSSNLVIGIDLKRSSGSEAAMKALAKAIGKNAEAARALAEAFHAPLINGPINTFNMGKTE